MKPVLASLLTCLIISMIVGYVQEPGFSKIGQPGSTHQHHGEPCESEKNAPASHHCSCIPCKIPHSQPLYTASTQAILTYHPIPVTWFQLENFQMESYQASPTVPPPRTSV